MAHKSIDGSFDFEILKQDGDKTISVKRLSDNVVFTVGDLVGLTSQIENGLYDDSKVLKIMTDTDRSNGVFPLRNVIFPAGTLVVKGGIIQLPNASHIDKTIKNYILKNSRCLSIKDLVDVIGHKMDNKKLLRFVDARLSNQKTKHNA